MRVELASLAAAAYWGFHDHRDWALKLMLGAGGPLLIALVWAIWTASRSTRRAPKQSALLERLIFGSATAALAISSGVLPASVFAVVATINTVLDHRFAGAPDRAKAEAWVRRARPSTRPSKVSSPQGVCRKCDHAHKRSFSH